MPQRGRGQGERRHRPHQRDQRPRHVRGRLSAQGLGAGRGQHRSATPTICVRRARSRRPAPSRWPIVGRATCRQCRTRRSPIRAPAPPAARARDQPISIMPPSVDRSYRRRAEHLRFPSALWSPRQRRRRHTGRRARAPRRRRAKTSRRSPMSAGAVIDAPPGVLRSAPSGVTRAHLRDAPPSEPSRASVREQSIEVTRPSGPPPVVPLGPSRAAQATGSIAPVAVSPGRDARLPDRLGARSLDRERRAAGGDALVRLAGRRDQADLRLFLPRHERQSARAHFRACLRQRARHRRLHARRRAQDHGEERLARLAGGAGLPARRAGRGLRAVHHRAGAGLERLSLRPHPRGSDARRSGHRACNPHAVSGEEVAARAGGRDTPARRASLRSPARSHQRRLPRAAQARWRNPDETSAARARLAAWPSRATTARTTISIELTPRAGDRPRIAGSARGELHLEGTGYRVEPIPVTVLRARPCAAVCDTMRTS